MNAKEVFVGFMAEKKAEGVSNRTIEAYSYAIEPLIVSHPQLPYKKHIIQEYVYSNNWSQQKRAFIYRHVNVFFNWAFREHGIDNVMTRILRPRIKGTTVRLYLTASEVRLLDLFLNDPEEEEHIRTRNKAMLYTLLDTGIRVGELLSMRFENIYEDSMLVNGKTGPRLAPLSRVTRSLIFSLPQYADGYVWHGLNRGANTPRLTRSGVRCITKKKLSRIGFAGKKGPHTFRHTFAVLALRLGMDIISVRDTMGHASIKTTEQYLKLAQDEVIESHHEHTPLQLITETQNV